MEQIYTNNLKGLHTDNTEIYQPENTYKFALNYVDNTTEKNEPFLSNETSNELNLIFDNSIVIGSIYIGDNQTVLFVVNNNNNYSGIYLDNNGVKETIIPLCSELNLSKYHKVYGTYRKIRGCEKTIYFTDYYNKPRYINLNNLNYLFENNTLIPEKLNLIDDYSFPDIELSVENSDGQLYAGSYNISIQYLNEDLNSTNWITTSETVNVYKENHSSNYNKIKGSFTDDSSDSLLNTLFKESKCNKKLVIKLNHKEENKKTFKYFRIAIIIARAHTGNITEVLVSNEYSIEDTKIIYTGNNEGYTKTTKEDLLLDKPDIAKVKHITQLDDRLILANGKGKEIDWCSLQRYASAIKADYYIKQVSAFESTIHENPKSNTTIKMGFMGGEVYAFGIVYIFKDGTQSPVYHIPGRPENMSNNSSNMDFYEVVNNTYENRDTLNGQDFWGNDYWGNSLTGQKIRHHKFPDRNDIPLVTPNNNPSSKIKIFKVQLTEEVPPSSYPVLITIKYKKNKDDKSKSILIYEDDYSSTLTIPISYGKLSDTYTLDSIDANNLYAFNSSEFTTIINNPINQKNLQLLNIKFSNIQLPENAIGYFIVVGERDEQNRKIIDKGFIQSLNIKTSSDNTENNYIVNCYFNNSQTTTNEARYIIYGKSPKILFHKDALYPKKIYIEGIYRQELIAYTESYQKNAFPGTSSTGLFYGLIKYDTDGQDWYCGIKHTIYHYHTYNYLDYNDPSDIIGEQELTISDSFYLKPADRKENVYYGSNNYTLINAELDSSVGIYKSENGGLSFSKTEAHKDDLFYVRFETGNEDIHPVLENIKYYKTHTNLATSHDIVVKEGDIYIQHFPQYHSTFYGSLQKRRWADTISNIVANILEFTGILTVTILTGGSSIAVAIGLLANIIGNLIAISSELLSQLLKDINSGELKDIINNKDFNYNTDVDLNAKQENDDTLLYVAENIEGVFVESELNTELRLKINSGATSYFDSFDFNELNTYTRSKYLRQDETRKDNNGDNTLTLIPISTPEIYQLNEDYNRKNKEKVFFPIPLTYKCNSKCLETWKNRILYSQRNFDESRTDNYKVFLPNNYRDIDNNYGEITDIKTLNNTLYIFTERMLYKIPPNYQERVNKDFISYIGTGEFLSMDTAKMVDDEIGVCGTTYKDSILKFMNSIFFVDDNNNKVYLITEEGLKCLSDIGMKKWFKNNLTFEISKLRDYSQISFKEITHDPQGYGFLTVFDEKYNRIILTKKDYTLDAYDYRFNFNTNIWEIYNGNNYVPITNSNILNNSFTISFSLNTMNWRSFHSYLPYKYYRTENSFKSIKQTQLLNFTSYIYDHNIDYKYGKFYNNTYDSIIEIILPKNNLLQYIDEFLKIITKSEIYNYDTQTSTEIRRNFFDKVIFYNSYQCSGVRLLDIKKENPTWLKRQVTNDIDSILVSKKEGIFNLNEIRDYRINYNLPIFNKNLINLQQNYYIDKILNNITIDINKSWNELQSFRDNYIGIRLYYNNSNNYLFKIFSITGLKQISYE